MSNAVFNKSENFDVKPISLTGDPSSRSHSRPVKLMTWAVKVVADQLNWLIDVGYEHLTGVRVPTRFRKCGG